VSVGSNVKDSSWIKLNVCIYVQVVPRYRGYQQQDAHEFLRYMLDRLHTELLGILPYSNSNSSNNNTNNANNKSNTSNTLNHFLLPTRKSTIVTAIFGGVLQNEVTCLICGTESKKHDPFLGKIFIFIIYQTID
jgi:ubiquitin carboxyl-terminal hydrolase 3